MRVALVLTTMLALLPAGTSAQGGPDVRPATVTLVDANGKQVGTVVGALTYYVTVAMTVNGRGALLVSTRTNSAAPGVRPLQGNNELGFESGDCSGAPLFETVVNALVPGSSVSGPGMTLYLPDPTASPTPVVWRSTVDAVGNCTSGFSVSRLSLRAVPILNLLTVFTPPFHLVFATAATPVPTVSGWGLMGMGGLLVALGFWAVRRRFASGTGASI